MARDLDTICLKCLEKEPVRRYASAAGLADDLGRFLRREPILARPVPHHERLILWARRNPMIALLGIALALSLWVGAVAVILTWQQKRQQANEANRFMTQPAEDAFANNREDDALSTLAAAFRRDRSGGLATRRLVSALSQRSFSLPITLAPKDGMGVFAGFLDPKGHYVLVTDQGSRLQLWSLPDGVPRMPPLDVG